MVEKLPAALQKTHYNSLRIIEGIKFIFSLDIDEFDGNKVTSIIIAKQNGRGTVLSSVSYNQHNKGRVIPAPYCVYQSHPSQNKRNPQ